MKRHATTAATSSSRTKRAKLEVPEYCDTPVVYEADGSTQWPAPRAQVERARQLIRQW